MIGTVSLTKKYSKKLAARLNNNKVQKARARDVTKIKQQFPAKGRKKLFSSVSLASCGVLMSPVPPQQA